MHYSPPIFTVEFPKPVPVILTKFPPSKDVESGTVIVGLSFVKEKLHAPSQILSSRILPVTTTSRASPTLYYSFIRGTVQVMDVSVMSLISQILFRAVPIKTFDDPLEGAKFLPVIVRS